MKTSIVRALGLACLLAGFVAACGGQSSGGGTDTNTNWLKHCEVDTDCAGLACLCNTCTRACDADSECSGEREVAVCISEPDACSAGARICVAADSTTGAAGSSTTVDPGAPPGAPADAPSACGRPLNEYFFMGTAICPELDIACLPPSQKYGDACGCGCTTVDAYPRRCRSQCPLGDECESFVNGEFPSLAATEVSWAELCPTQGAYEGTCSNGKRFFFYSNGFAGEVRYYDSSGQRFLGRGSFTDDVERTCGGQYYWPEPVLCDTPTVTRVFCGGRSVGDIFDDLPWADGRPGDLP